LGRTGIAVAHALRAGGARVVVWDDAPVKRDEAEKNGLTVFDLGRTAYEGMSALVVSPGVPLHFPSPHPAIQKARAGGVEIMGDVEIFARILAQTAPRPRLVGVTGTNGKSTTTALIGHLLKEAGWNVAVGGNIGRAVLDLEPPGNVQAYVLELSSYQLDLTETLAPDVAVLLNITPDHIDRHGHMEGYIAAKKRIFARQGKGDFAVIGIDDLHTADICTQICGKGEVRALPVSVGKTLSRGAFVVDGILYDGMSAKAARICNLKELPRLPGLHNWQNAAAAYTACRALGLDAGVLEAGLRSFLGLAHRQEVVANLFGVRFINDSKATNADAAARALASYDHIYWIAGGRPKTGGISALSAYFPKIIKAYLIGEAADEFAATLEGQVAYEKCGVLDQAVQRAAREAFAAEHAAAVILLSPACASFDQFTDFEARGDAFRRVVNTTLQIGQKQGAGGT
jgi:UDP-N-acetylmuramoylalanine--D-glutamate ligase